MYCDTCGKELPHSAHYCPACGSPVHQFVDPADLPIVPKYEGFFDGRIGRIRYLAGTGFSLAPLFGLALMWAIVNTTTGVLNEWLYAFLLLLLIPAVVFSIAMHVGLTIRRCHDVGLNGLFTVLAYVPYIGLFFIIYLVSMRGNLKTNQYGPQPHPNRDFIDELFNYDLRQLQGLITFISEHVFGMALVTLGVPVLVILISRILAQSLM